ncbi:BrnT family toxin [Hydrogenimonas sp. SS33]|uniref:BrnT family toxin n=1 Tax=Hydrogenimonas leucolamina TaxID=2954236 RepID=UPI00336BD40D
MEFEYDPLKSRSNLQKHGIDFEQAKVLWEDERMVEIPLSFPDEPRQLFIGNVNGKIWSAVTTRRNGKIRIISVRRARKKEIEIYDNS